MCGRLQAMRCLQRICINSMYRSGLVNSQHSNFKGLGLTTSIGTVGGIYALSVENKQTCSCLRDPPSGCMLCWDLQLSVSLRPGTTSPSCDTSLTHSDNPQKMDGTKFEWQNLSQDHFFFWNIFHTIWYKLCPPADQSQYNVAVNMDKLCCHWLKYLQDDKISVLPLNDGVQETIGSQL